MFRDAFPDIRQCVVYRCSSPRGVERLTELGRAIYFPTADNRRRTIDEPGKTKDRRSRQQQAADA
jgi:hypothetical protein